MIKISHNRLPMEKKLDGTKLGQKCSDTKVLKHISIWDEDLQSLQLDSRS